MINTLKHLWSRDSGYKQILTIAFPLILSTASWSVLHFIDRMFLTWYSDEAVAACMSSSILSFSIIAIFIGAGSYVGTFIAQYFGAKQYDKIGAILWQGIYLAIIGSLIVMAIAPFSALIFRLIGHTEALQKYETTYFRMMCLGAIGPIGSNMFAGFFSGRNKNWPVMWINCMSTAINLILDYIFIFGKFGFPELGVTGAALATIISGFVSVLVYAAIIMRPLHNKQFKTLSGWRFDKELFSRLIRFGMPSGIHFFLDMFAFTLFMLFIGYIGVSELAATSIAFNINSLAFMPMIGIGITTSMLVGQNIGEGNIKLASRSVWSGFHLTLIYMGTIALAYAFLPEIFIFPFESHADPADFIKIKQITTILLKFLALYCLCDAMNIIFSSAIKGAGDTKFVMYLSVFLSFGLLVLPTFIGIVVFKINIYITWLIATVYINILGIIFLLRFLTGKWKKMKVIETVSHSVPTNYPEISTSEFDI